MGWQSYVLGFSTQEEKQEILALCQLHNDVHRSVRSDMTTEEQHLRFEAMLDERGEELEGFMEAHFKPGKQYKKRAWPRGLSECSSVILCGNGGGRYVTFQFFSTALQKGRSSRYIVCEPYCPAISKRLTKPVDIDVMTGNPVATD
jgi:hypothetical protein